MILHHIHAVFFDCTDFYSVSFDSSETKHHTTLYRVYFEYPYADTVYVCIIS